MNGEHSNVWFDRKSVTIEAQENRKSMASIYETINEMLKREIEGCGIPAKRIVVGGFSMGGCLAMHTGFHLNQNLGGVFALSAFLNNESVVYESLEGADTSTLPKLKFFHGERFVNLSFLSYIKMLSSSGIRSCRPNGEEKPLKS